ncbi:hypothetical protein Goshw_010535, partial [Gossypium schwendimanii]|nr:hypothetical protein [Gossypium schwendimanii]
MVEESHNKELMGLQVFEGPSTFIRDSNAQSRKVRELIRHFRIGRRNTAVSRNCRIVSSNPASERKAAPKLANKMSTDSDDEDELLQRALKDQSTRDLNYQKPSSSNPRKPVVNFVQPPPKPKGSASPAPKNPKGRKMSMDEDEDSEVEMLSISSGDEDVGKDPKGGAGGRGRGRPMKDDDGVWDGEEPDTWKRVDETELARRVREMRESRTAPVAQKFERKATTAPVGRALNTLQSFPRGMECVDPLGLGIIDNKTLRLITASSESSHAEKEHLDSNLREKLMYFSEKFDAKLFLSRIHQDTPAADLEAGALGLKTDLQGRTQQRKHAMFDGVKTNFFIYSLPYKFIDFRCLEIVLMWRKNVACIDIESKLKRIEEDPEGSGTTHLFKCMQGVCSLADRAFEPLFERQAQAEKIRSVQGMLQRFRTLFNLPSTIRGSISKGEYDLAVREYKKAKSIALPS